MRILKLYRGIPGSGKSTLANKANPKVFEADQYFMKSGTYNFNPSKLGEAHRECIDNVEQAMLELEPIIAVANTFTTLKEIAPYESLARAHGYNVEVYHVVGNWGSIHNVPNEALDRMKKRWEPYKNEVTLNNNKE